MKEFNKNSLIEKCRQNVVEDLFATKSFHNCWEIWKEHILADNKTTSERGFISIGSKLAEIFSKTGTSGRNQSDLSMGGVAWESLNCWYMNIMLLGTPAIVLKKSSHVPQPVKDALCVSYKGLESNSESDLVAVTFPDDFDPFIYTNAKKSEFFDTLSSECEKKPVFNQLSVSVIQCKTNWNDNSQKPMLWSMLYDRCMNDGQGSQDDENLKVFIGKNGYYLKDLKHFSYAFSTVPTNRLLSFKAGMMAVERVKLISGGNYWGHETKSNVAKSIYEIFRGARIGPINGKGAGEVLSQLLEKGSVIPEYFKL